MGTTHQKAVLILAHVLPRVNESMIVNLCQCHNVTVKHLDQKPGPSFDKVRNTCSTLRTCLFPGSPDNSKLCKSRIVSPSQPTQMSPLHVCPEGHSAHGALIRPPAQVPARPPGQRLFSVHLKIPGTTPLMLQRQIEYQPQKYAGFAGLDCIVNNKKGQHNMSQTKQHTHPNMGNFSTNNHQFVKPLGYGYALWPMQTEYMNTSFTATACNLRESPG